MNPPYGRTIGLWIAKAYHSAQAGATVVALIPARTDTQWWHEFVTKAAEVRLLQGRLKFGGATSSARSRARSRFSNMRKAFPPRFSPCGKQGDWPLRKRLLESQRASPSGMLNDNRR